MVSNCWPLAAIQMPKSFVAKDHNRIVSKSWPLAVCKCLTFVAKHPFPIVSKCSLLAPHTVAQVICGRQRSLWNSERILALAVKQTIPTCILLFLVKKDCLRWSQLKLAWWVEICCRSFFLSSCDSTALLHISMNISWRQSAYPSLKPDMFEQYLGSVRCAVKQCYHMTFSKDNIKLK